ncbi:MAG: hypothetical protein GKR90_16325 [Pseudomonadales bacterium]|nr:hypothetical protein [Pseudomonadales bacterium]
MRIQNVLIVITLGLASHTWSATPLFPDDPSSAIALSATLEVDLKALMKAGAELPGVFKLQTASGADQSFAVKVSPRGKSRQERCSFYPLWLDFKKSELPDTVLADQNKLKLVTHCSRSFSSRGYVAAEMLVYRLLNLMTDASFRVRAINMTYQDSNTGKSSSHPAFFIEHKRAMVERLGASLVDQPKLKVRDLDPEMSARLALFQYLAGNTDFSMTQGPDPEECCHNAVPIALTDSANTGVVSIPYDFDVTGFVNVPYAAPVPSLGITRLTQRLYRGYCAHNEHLANAITEFRTRQADIINMVESFADLDGVRTKKHVKFIEGFFKTVGNERTQQSRLYRKCR